MPPKKTQPATSSSVYVVTQTDHEDRNDAEGRTSLISVHGTLESANAAVSKRSQELIKSYKLEDPNTNESTFKNGTKKFNVVIGEDEFHSATFESSIEPLIDGSVNPAAAAKSEESAKETNPKAHPAANGNTAKAKAKAAKTAEAEEEVADEDEGEVYHKEIVVPESGQPDGKPNCLAGKSFIITGTLEGFNREEAQTLIEMNGGLVEKSMKKTIDYVVLGVKAGPKKLEQIEDWGLKTIDRQGLYDLIAESPAGGIKRSAEPEAEKKKPAAKRAKKA